MNPDVTLLLSGGIDSTALLYFYLEQGQRVQCMHFSYGQRNEKSELDASKKIANYYNVDLFNIKIDFPLQYKKDEILFRNLFLVLSAASFSKSTSRISIAVHGGTDYYDCSQKFIDHCQNILDGYFMGGIRLEAPFLLNQKEDILEYSNKNSIPLALTYSCLKSNSPCGECKSCLQRVGIS
jgi:7-cyano-7-deazaguanine synthase